MTFLQVLGSGCSKCALLAKHAEQAAQALHLEYTLDKVTDPHAIMAFGLVATPALVVDGEVKVSGHVPTVESIKAMLA